MSETKKSNLHRRNQHQSRYDFKLLLKKCPELADFVTENKYGDETIDFFNPDAVKTLNKALLMHYYEVNFWDIPKGYLCPPIPGRADYIHHVADVLSGSNYGKIPKGNKIKCLDIGVGANCVYPIIGNHEYGWLFIGSDIDPIAIESANKIISNTPSLKANVECRLQEKPTETFYGILQKGEKIDVSICNPPFHSSKEEADEGSQRKLSNLKKRKITKTKLNFGGQSNELWTDGGERKFIIKMIKQSTQFAKSCAWFSTLVSKQSNLKYIYDALEEVNVGEYKTIDMGTSNKATRIVVWTFLSVEEEKEWVKERWETGNISD